MTRPTGIPITSFAQARTLQAAKRLGEAVTKPAILTLADIQYSLDPLRANRQVYIQFCGEDDRRIQLGTVTQLRNAVKQLDYPMGTPVYLRSKEKKQPLNAWPIIWKGTVGKNYILVAYVDPVRYGFKSQAKTLLTIGPSSPMPLDKRKFGLQIVLDPYKTTIRFEPMVESCLVSAKARKPLETISARKLTFRYRRPSLKTLLGITKAKKRLKKELGITEAMKPFRWWTNTKRRFKRKIGYESEAGRLIRNGVRRPGGCLVIVVVALATVAVVLAR